MQKIKVPAILAWSGGKDSALALQTLLSQQEYDIISLLTTVTDDYDRISMHGVRRELLESQAAALGLPVDIIGIPKHATNTDYGRAMGDAMDRWNSRQVHTVVFGDIHLADVRQYRENNLRGTGMSAIFPLWGKDPRHLIRHFIESGFRAVVTCVDTEALDGSFAGRELDDAFLADLPPGADPCGENGEYHSFVFDGPLFARPVAFGHCGTVLRDGRFMYADLVPA